ncbi:MAG: expansin EXLX1 family cellulose-binding protein [Dermatophilaceae bacterium]
MRIRGSLVIAALVAPLISVPLASASAPSASASVPLASASVPSASASVPSASAEDSPLLHLWFLLRAVLWNGPPMISPQVAPPEPTALPSAPAETPPARSKTAPLPTPDATPRPTSERAPSASPATPGGASLRSGEGTYYGATGEGNCSFEKSPDNMMVAAMNQVDYDNSQMCGAFVEVRGPKGTETVRIVDRCPECSPGDIDLSAEAFARIAEPIDGRVPISWRVVSPEIDGPVSFRFKEGSTQYWTAVQVRNHRNPVAKLEYQPAGGSFTEAKREIYNYFVVDQGMGPGPYTFRVTDIYGNTVTERNVALEVATVISGSGQFPKP